MKYYIPENVFQNDMEINYSYHKNLNDFIGIHEHDFHELFIILSGELIHNLNGEKNLLATGTLVMVHESDVHFYEKSNNSECEYINIAFTKETFEKYANLIGSPNQINVLMYNGNYQIMVDSRFLDQIKMKCENISSCRFIHFRAISLFFDIISYLVESIETDISNSFPYIIRKFCSDLQNPNNFDKQLKMIFIKYSQSYEHSCRSFKKHLGETPTIYFNKAKMNYARNLLVLTDYKVLDICSNCGFDNVGHFYKLFKRCHNMTPAKFRAKYKLNTI